MEIEPTQTKPSDSGLIVDASAEKSENDYYFNSYSHFGTFSWSLLLQSLRKLIDFRIL
jgi:hypothetical protein